VCIADSLIQLAIERHFLMRFLLLFCLDFVAILISYWRVFFAPENRWKQCMSYFHDSLQR